MAEKKLSEVTDQQCYEIAVLEGWKRLWEEDRKCDIDYWELVDRGRDIVDGEISGKWVSYDRVNEYLKNNGYERLTPQSNNN